ncbi:MULTISPECIES: diguanylate phosphodiesterase [Vibrio]|uniref:Diguanylate phosphodiesterase n=1 Tax=Vibrio neptunius TaxID=170651 RepID=A0ABS3A478_9VIBR|nr:MULTISPECIES: diguanylate phosphodiesterase [Vibrio]KJY91918.1 diguanylate phosphodiesterase [Vibrio neptunius]MBN3494273.1 diguanylate phosphodiesterase [Vibrio neptunius]MBN3516677.1 diguanylate phosphodiesterase [Vibrio neptunius]MBN3550945.1 diguanylate phosphodiesterase [Vibrio neptunius]MBN3579138.1 diguanylate phosphodiesterase [Vibrio neptunius]
MANLNSNQAMYRYIAKLMEEHLETEDDQIIHQALVHNDIRHACQAIRSTDSGEVEFQHLTLRFGGDGEQSVYQFDLSQKVTYCLDLFSLYLALRQTGFQLETFHPDLISNVVVPLQVDALVWAPGEQFLEQVLLCHKKAFQHVIPSLQLSQSLGFHTSVEALIERVEQCAYALWFEVTPPCTLLEQLAHYQPSMLKLSVSLKEKQDRMAFLPIVRFMKKHKLKWVASRVACQKELNQYKLLGASYYFGYFSDIPTSLSFKTFTNEYDI